jgi:hypothetical protein
MVEKDVEYGVKNLILSNNPTTISITNEFHSDGIVRYGGRAIGLLEFKLKRNLGNENTAGQILAQSMCYYYKLAQKEKIDYTKPFYLIIGDENEIMLINIHQFPNNWVMNSKWGAIAPSKAGKESDLLEVAISMLKLSPPVYYKYEKLEELSFGFHLLLSNLLN